MKRLLLLGATVLVTVGIATPVGASTGREYGQHVADCARAMGFTGTHNPGMHRGIGGWDGMPCDM